MVLSLSLALALGGCAFVAKKTSTPTATGALKGISTLIPALSSDASGNNPGSICSSVLSTALEQRLNRIGGCTKIVTAQLLTVSDYTLTPTKYGLVNSTSAIALVKAKDNGKDRVYTLHFVKQAKGGWRINSIG
jgi:hypothetical protein